MSILRSASAIVMGAVLGTVLPQARAEDPMPAVRADRWSDAAAAAASDADPLALKLVTYFRLLAPRAASAPEIAAFLDANPDWPNRPLLQKRWEEALAREPDGPAALAQCRRGVVHLADAQLRCADVFTAAGDADSAAASVRAAWRDGITDRAAESAFLVRFGAIVRPDDQWARFSELAWTNPDAAARQISRLEPTRRAAGQARLALKRLDVSAPTLFAALPPAQRAEPALVLEYARWLRRSGRDAAAASVWIASGEAAQRGVGESHRGEFWAERNILARRLLESGDPATAYAVAALPGQTAPAEVADAAFLAGFIALRRLGDPQAALGHFQTAAAIARAAISQARAHYWIGRALAAAGRDPAASYTRAAAFPLSFYGQRAALASGGASNGLAASIRHLRDPVWTRSQVFAFADGELARAAILLAGWGEPRRASAFLLRADELAADTSSRSIDARLALGLGLPEVAVGIARRVGHEGLALPDAGWPIPLDPPPGTLDPAVILGLIRQESSFDVGAASPAGARGLMQLMPATAQSVASRIGEQTSPDRPDDGRRAQHASRIGLPPGDARPVRRIAAARGRGLQRWPQPGERMAGRQRRSTHGGGRHAGLDRADTIHRDAQLRATGARKRRDLPRETT